MLFVQVIATCALVIVAMLLVMRGCLLLIVGIETTAEVVARVPNADREVVDSFVVRFVDLRGQVQEVTLDAGGAAVGENLRIRYFEHRPTFCRAAGTMNTLGSDLFVAIFWLILATSLWSPDP